MSNPVRILPCAEPAPEALLKRFAALPVANISDNMQRLFAGGAQLRPWHDGTPMCGTALTVRTRPGDNLMVHKALDMARPGDVIVVEAGGELTNAIIGEIMLRYGISRGVAGFVIDGAIRDVEPISAGSMPVFAAGVTHRGPYKDGPGEINVPVTVGQMLVNPGDIMVGDADGVLAVPQAEAETIAALTEKQNAAEDQAFRAITAGTYDRSWVDKALLAKGFSSELERLNLVRLVVPQGQELYSGDDSALPKVMSLGNSGVISGVSSAFPRVFAELVEALEGGDATASIRSRPTSARSSRWWVRR